MSLRFLLRRHVQIVNKILGEIDVPQFGIWPNDLAPLIPLIGRASLPWEVATVIDEIKFVPFMLETKRH